MNTTSALPGVDLRSLSRAFNVLLAAMISTSTLWLAVPAARGWEVPPSARSARAPDQRQKVRAPEIVDDQVRKDVVLWSMVTLTAIVLVTLVLLAFVVIWGHRARRLARYVPPVAPRDELWFLKSRKKTAGIEPFRSPREGADDGSLPPEEPGT